MEHPARLESVETVIVGGGQAGLATAYEMQRRGRPAVVLDAGQRVGDSWRHRWDSLRLFTPARLSHLPGMQVPAGGWSFLTKDEFAAYLEAYVDRFGLDVRLGTRVERIEREGARYLVTAGATRLLAEQVVIATGAYQDPKVPVFAPELAADIVQVHSSGYRNPRQLQEGPVLVVGAGNSGAEIALELAGTHQVSLSGSAPVFPVRPGSLPSRVVMPAFFFAASRILTVKTPLGRKMRPRALHHAAPVVRVRPRDLAVAGVQRVPRVTGAEGGLPVLADGQRLDVRNVVWCTGFQSDHSWVQLPAFASGDEPEHERGVVRDEDGIYLVGQRFQYSLSSSFVGGVGRDAAYIAGAIAERAKRRERERAMAGSTA